MNNEEDNTNICEVENESGFMINTIINVPAIRKTVLIEKYDQKIKTHHKYCFCNTKNLLCFCLVKNHKMNNPQINKNVLHLILSERFPLDINEGIIKQLNRKIYFQEYHKILERQNELNEISKVTGNEFYDEFYYYINTRKNKVTSA